MIMQYLAAGLAATTLLAGGGLWLQTERVSTLNAELKLARAELQTCGGRLDAVLRDVRSDNAIDELPDDDLRDVPDHWLIPDEIDRPSQN